MNAVFPILIFVSVFFGFLTGNIQAVSKAAMESSLEAVKLSFTLMGTICLWNGIMRTAEAAGITSLLAKVFSPLIRLLFGQLPSKALQAVSMNLSANLLGLGNAATPLGLQAMAELNQTKQVPDDTASDQMVLFTVMNTSSLQLIPVTVAGLRLSCGSTAPMEILPAVWIVSAAALTASVLAAKILSRFFR